VRQRRCAANRRAAPPTSRAPPPRLEPPQWRQERRATLGVHESPRLKTPAPGRFRGHGGARGGTRPRIAASSPDVLGRARQPVRDARASRTTSEASVPACEADPDHLARRYRQVRRPWPPSRKRDLSRSSDGTIGTAPSSWPAVALVEAAQNAGAYADGTAHITGDLYVERPERVCADRARVEAGIW
jgi:hypothetical protein